jgi:hypothetical protein
MLFTLVEPWRGRQVDYNRWYEGDHFYATLLGPGVFAGRRFVCPAQLKTLRDIGAGEIVPAPEIGSYLAIYWMTDPAEFNRWGAANALALHAAGRVFTERDHVHTLMYDLVTWSAKDELSPSPELALDHPFAFLVVEVLAADDGAPADSDRIAATGIDAGADLVCAFEPVELLESRPGDVPRATGALGALTVLHFFSQGSPESALRSLEGQQSGNVRFRSAFLPTVPGTDCYTDALW